MKIICEKKCLYLYMKLQLYSCLHIFENARSKIKKIQRLLAWFRFIRRAPYVRFHTFILLYLTTVSNGHEYFISVTLTTCSD